MLAAGGNFQRSESLIRVSVTKGREVDLPIILVELHEPWNAKAINHHVFQEHGDRPHPVVRLTSTFAGNVLINHEPLHGLAVECRADNFHDIALVVPVPTGLYSHILNKYELVPGRGLEPAKCRHMGRSRTKYELVPGRGLEPPIPYGNMVLSHARIPIPPPRHKC